MFLPRCSSLVFIVVLVFGTVISSRSWCQSKYNFQPAASYNADSKELITALRKLMDQELERLLVETRHRDFIRKLYAKRTDYIVDLVKAKVFLRNDSLESYAHDVVNRLTEANPTLTRPLVLVARTPEVNALCYARGIYIVTVGLLARISTEGELAFTLAHELAHGELDHVKVDILREAEIRLAQKSQEQLKKILSGDVDLADLQEFRDLAYGVSRMNRQREFQADSLGYLIFNASSYANAHVSSMIEVLKTWEQPKHKFGAELLEPIDSENFPLQDEFFAEQLSLYQRRPSGTLIFSMDSLRSHPDLNKRKKLLEQAYREDPVEDGYKDEEFVRAITRRAEFETVEGAFRTANYDWCLYHALHLLVLYPNDSYLISRAAAVLVHLYEIKDEYPDRMNRFVSRFTGNYGEVARLINNMLHNLTTRETGEIAFYLLENPKHFDNSNPSHYYLLWKISGKLNYLNIRDQTRAEYKKKFNANINDFKWPYELED